MGLQNYFILKLKKDLEIRVQVSKNQEKKSILILAEVAEVSLGQPLESLVSSFVS